MVLLTIDSTFCWRLRNVDWNPGQTQCSESAQLLETPAVFPGSGGRGDFAVRLHAHRGALLAVATVRLQHLSEACG